MCTPEALAFGPPQLFSDMWDAIALAIVHSKVARGRGLQGYMPMVAFPLKSSSVTFVWGSAVGAFKFDP